MKNMRDRLLVAFGVLALSVVSAASQGYPSKSVRIIVPSAAGGASDIVTRAVAEQLATMWGHPIVVENRAGAANQIGAEFVGRSEPDGYTLMSAASSFVLTTLMTNKPTYDPIKDFTPLSGLAVINPALVVHPSVPVHNLAEFIALAKAKPASLNYATFGVGTPPHLSMALLESMADVTLTAVHYRGGSLALNDLIGGHVQTVFISVGQLLQPWKAGQLRPIAAGSMKRVPEIPDLPTIDESGLTGFEALTWFGMLGPAKMPKDIVDKINRDVNKIVNDPAFAQKFLAPNFFVALPGSAEEFGDVIRSDVAKWSKLINERNIGK
jgi:tripartite-type tricarboxylate transporter receptor subunit TctC